MPKQIIILPDLHDAGPHVHAVRVGELLYTSAMAPLDRGGRLASRTAPGQARRIFENLDAVLRSAGAAWHDVARVTVYAAPPLPAGKERRAIEEVMADFLPPGEQAGMEVAFGLPRPGQRLAVELVAHIGTVKRVFAAKGETAPLGPWAAGVQAGRSIYLSGRRAAAAGARLTKGGAGRDLAVETREVYQGFDRLLAAAGSGWGDLVRVRQFINDTGIRFDEVRQGRGDFVPLGRFLSTSVSCGKEDPAGNPGAWRIAVDLEATRAPKTCITTNDVPDTPGVVHALRAGDLIHFQAQISADQNGHTVHPDEPAAQAHRVFSTLDRMLHAAGVDWPDVVLRRMFCKRGADLAVFQAVEAEWVGRPTYAHAELIAAFFETTVLLEIELVAAARR
jgi:enamine deaminase RidA (YjgF/YER057c/UK114 family)